MNIKISVITPTVRPEGLELVRKALKRQTIKEFEWLIISPWPFDNPKESTWIQDPQIKEGNYWSLNMAMNKAIAKAKGELIVSWQDYTYAKPDALEKFWFHYQQEPKTLVSGVGNKYMDDMWIAKTWQDPRERDDQGTYYPCYPSDIEYNFCAVPKAALYAVGGYDESLDKYAGMDGYSVSDRLGILGGWDFKLDQTNKSYSLEHGRLPEWDKCNALGAIYNEKRKEYLKNPNLPYLQSQDPQT